LAVARRGAEARQCRQEHFPHQHVARDPHSTRRDNGIGLPDQAHRRRCRTGPRFGVRSRIFEQRNGSLRASDILRGHLAAVQRRAQPCLQFVIGEAGVDGRTRHRT
jgi:hypothetical protein